MNLRSPVTAGVTALVTAGLVCGCTAAPSGRLDTAPYGGLPSQQPTAPAAVTALPTFDASSTVGDYADGFPRSLVEAPEGATVIASSAQPLDGGLTRISLNLSTPASSDDVLAQLGGPLAAAGFAPTQPQALSGLTAQTAWTRRSERPEGPLIETLLIGVLDDGDSRLVSVSGTVATPPD
ncbi:hypothetical protein [Xylanimonas ulmi]|uniref:Uncharacterized protein n=1 Tax=Xylanimonas ulmi TaxID=228973 RepID=A0A4V2EXS5_9MICO|nr:hypothetical protein [Xylanibacterium ulmi]RZS60510.1 hypothetical protein EV386_0768 [Xylanibacterium ulmi]